MKYRIPEQSKIGRPNNAPSSREFLTQLLSELTVQRDFQQQLVSTVEKYLHQDQDEISLDFLPIITAIAMQGNLDQTTPIVTAWQLVRLSAKLFDDVEDGDGGNQCSVLTNLATGYMFAAQLALDKLCQYGFTYEQSEQIRFNFNRACIRTCEGQHTDLSTIRNHIFLDPDNWFKLAESKSGELFAWASWAGVMTADVNEQIKTAFWKFGLHLGVLVQIADDFNDLWNSQSNINLATLYSALPLSYAYYVAETVNINALNSIFSEPTISNRDRVTKMQKLVSEMGGQRFVLATAWIKRQEAFHELSQMSLPDSTHQRLNRLLDRVFPVLNSINANILQ